MSTTQIGSWSGPQHAGILSEMAIRSRFKPTKNGPKMILNRPYSGLKMDLYRLFI